LQKFRNFFKDQAFASEVNFFQPVFIIFVEAILEHLHLPTDFSIHSVNGTRGETIVCMKDGEAKTVVGYSDVSIEFEGRTDIGELKPPFKETGLFHTAARQSKDQYIMQQQIFKSSGFLTDSITVDGERTNHLLTGRYMEEKKFIIIILMQLLSREEMPSCFCLVDEEYSDDDSDDETNEKEKCKKKRTDEEDDDDQWPVKKRANAQHQNHHHRIRSANLFLEVLQVRRNET